MKACGERTVAPRVSGEVLLSWATADCVASPVGQESEPAPALAFSCSLLAFDLGCLLRPKTLERTAPPRNRRSRAVVERLSIWLYQFVTILVNSSIFSNCSRVYCSDGSPSLASWTQCSRRAIVGSIS